MHDCKSASLTLATLGTNETTERESGFLAELHACPTCREELASVRNAVRVANDALRAVEPAADFWPAYHDRLQRRLIAEIETNGGSVSWVPRWFAPLTASIRIPVPVGLAMVLLLAATSAFSVSQYLRRVDPPVPIQADSIGPKIVPLIRQETVTRVVYVKRTGSRSGSDAGQVTPKDRTVARLSGFKPTSEVKLTIIKGSVDEK